MRSCGARRSTTIYDTVSQLLGVPLGTVKANVFYAKGMLRQRLQRRLQLSAT